MKKLIGLILASTLVLSASAKSFEGIVHYKLTSRGHDMTNTYAIKGDQLRMEMSTGKNEMIGLYSASTGEVAMLMPAQNMYMTFGGMDKMVEKATETDGTLEKTGRSETIAGYSCDEYIVKDDKQTYEIWCTKGLGRYVSFSDVQRSRGKNPVWVTLLLEKELFPLRTIVKDRRGKVRSSMEATLVEPKQLDASLFEIPEGYKKFEMPNLGGLLKSMGN